MAAKSWEIFTARKDKNGDTYFVFNDSVEIVVDGRKIDLVNKFKGANGDDITIKKLQGNSETKMQEREEALQEKGFLSEEQIEKRRAYRNKAKVVNTVIGHFVSE